LSAQTPPLFGKRSDICGGQNPKTSEELRRDSHMDTKDAWTIYLVVAVFVTMFITAIATFLVVKFCCSGMMEKDGSVSPRP
jgi:hypothetical protein